MQAAESSNRVNGINLNVLKETVSAIQGDPELGKCKFRARNKWIDANHNCTTISGFYGAKQEIAHKQEFELHADEPPILAGNDEGANPVEHLLHALASCVTTSMVAHAAVRGIHIEELESKLEGDIDLRGFLGLDAKKCSSSRAPQSELTLNKQTILLSAWRAEDRALRSSRARPIVCSDCGARELEHFFTSTTGGYSLCAACFQRRAECQVAREAHSSRS